MYPHDTAMIAAISQHIKRCIVNSTALKQPGGPRYSHVLEGLKLEGRNIYLS